MNLGIHQEQESRVMLCEIGRRLWNRGLVSANDGNLSIRLAPDRILCTPSGISKGFLAPEDLIITDMDGVAISAGKASSELKMHLEIYRQRKDVNAVVHAHPPHATAFALQGRVPPRFVMAEMEVLLGPMALLPYKSPGTVEFAEAFREQLQNFEVFILSNHGATCIGKTLEDAWHRMESLDQSCKILLLAEQTGKLVEIPDAMRIVLEQQRTAYRALH